MMQRRTALKLFSLLPLVGSGVGASPQQTRQFTGRLKEYFRLAWWTASDSKTPLAAVASWNSDVGGGEDGSQLTESTLAIIKKSESKSAELFKCTETGRFLFAMPLQGTTMLATVWLGASAYLIKVLRFHENRIDVVLEERSATFECLYESGDDEGVQIITSDTRGFPGEVKRWRARVLIWRGDKFQMRKECRFKDRLSL